MKTDHPFQEHQHNPKVCLLLTPTLGRLCQQLQVLYIPHHQELWQ